MSRNGINKEQIFKAAGEIIHSGQLPTVSKIRSSLTTGSITTIQKYLRIWKEECFKNGNLLLLNQPITGNNQKNDLIHYEFLEQKRKLEQALNKQLIRNEHYAQELINAEKTSVDLKEENRQLQITNQELLLKLTAVEAANNALWQTTQEINNKLDANDNKTIQKMQQTIDALRIELKILNETSLTVLRETSNKGHEILMQEKVTSINLQVKIDSLTKELLESKKQLHEAITTAQVQNRSLLRQNEELQSIIQEHGLDKLPQLEERLRLNPNIKIGATIYAK